MNAIKEHPTLTSAIRSMDSIRSMGVILEKTRREQEYLYKQYVLGEIAYGAGWQDPDECCEDMG